MKRFNLYPLAVVLAAGLIWSACTQDGAPVSPVSSDSVDSPVALAKPAGPPGLEVKPQYRVPTGKNGERLTVFVFYANGMFIVFTNGVGLDHDEIRTGNAMILDPNGIIMTESTAVDSDMVITELRRDALEGTLGRMHTRTRTPELYETLVEESKAVDTREARNALTKNSRIV